jgi:hypothetical protein
MLQYVHRLRTLGLKSEKIILDSGGRSVLTVLRYFAGVVLVIKMLLDPATRWLILRGDHNVRTKMILPVLIMASIAAAVFSLAARGEDDDYWEQTYEEAQEEYFEDDWYEEEDDAAAYWTDSYECTRYKDGWTDESPETECERDDVNT